MPNPPKVEVVALENLQDDPRNANRGTERGNMVLEKSVRKLGAGRSMVIDAQGRIVAGNKTRQALLDAGFTEAIVVETDGKRAVVVRRKDFDLDDENGNAREYAYADNRTAELDLDWDPAQLKADLDAGFDFGDLFSEKELEIIFAKDEIDFPDDNPHDAPEDDGRVLIEIRCNREAMPFVKDLLAELSKVDGCEVNISG